MKKTLSEWKEYVSEISKTSRIYGYSYITIWEANALLSDWEEQLKTLSESVKEIVKDIDDEIVRKCD